MLKNTKEKTKNGQSKETGNIDEDKQNKSTTQCVYQNFNKFQPTDSEL
jgi:hypothetical protein